MKGIWYIFWRGFKNLPAGDSTIIKFQHSSRTDTDTIKAAVTESRFQNGNVFYSKVDFFINVW